MNNKNWEPIWKTSKRYERAKERVDNGIQRAVQLHQHSDKCRLKPQGSTSHPSHWYHPFLYSSFIWVWGQWGRSDTAGGHLHCCKPSGKESGSIWYTQVSRHPGTPNFHSWRRPCAQRHRRHHNLAMNTKVEVKWKNMLMLEYYIEVRRNKLDQSVASQIG